MVQSPSGDQWFRIRLALEMLLEVCSARCAWESLVFLRPSEEPRYLGHRNKSPQCMCLLPLRGAGLRYRDRTRKSKFNVICGERLAVVPQDVLIEFHGNLCGKRASSFVPCAHCPALRHPRYICSCFGGGS